MTDVPAHLPHRRPFLLVDRVVEREPGIRAVAEKLVTGQEPCFRGSKGAVPAPLLLEMLAQTGGFLESDPLHGSAVFLAGIRDARFPAAAHPGDRLRLEAVADGAFAGMMKVQGTVTCDGRELCTASLLVKRL
ncbi:3-hydroxyacyl-ACP dehydratase FabZ family protein [Geothrix sp. 21YS21S-4]|uniref:3-hydroxyacyl-ACP dehydratase FabZ family protein n=1 Tax=Geothrix sp. 21YS21S-4 TaxID=3068889 RepID=UPI0027B99FE7|nr:3-hydroxyacyl-ACP dehydratase FabZ family protein [Geothrix sp. 21YS21S-4]